MVHRAPLFRIKRPVDPATHRQGDAVESSSLMPSQHLSGHPHSLYLEV